MSLGSTVGKLQKFEHALLTAREANGTGLSGNHCGLHCNGEWRAGAITGKLLFLVPWFKARLHQGQQGSHRKKCWRTTMACILLGGREPTGTPTHNGTDGLQQHLKPGDMPSMSLGELILGNHCFLHWNGWWRAGAITGAAPLLLVSWFQN
jgi:hypothetical protein